MFFKVANSIFMLFICMAVGYVCKKIKLINEEAIKGFSTLLFKITLPGLIISSLQKPYSKELLVEGAASFFICMVIFASGILFGWILIKLLKAGVDEQGIWLFILVFPNVGYMGLPVITSLYEDKAAFLMTGAILAFNVFSFSLGIQLINIGNAKHEKISMKSIVFNPVICAAVTGLILFLFSIKLPWAVSNAISSMGNMTTPLSMIIVGAALSENKVSEIFADWKLYIVCSVRLLLIPVITFLVLRIFVSEPRILGVFTIIAAMPAASATAILASQYNANTDLASKAIFVSTLFSIVTIPAVSLLIP